MATTDAKDRSHLTGDPAAATNADLLNTFGGLASRIARFPADPNGSQANQLCQMRDDLDLVRAEALRRMGTEAAPSVTAACLGGACELCPGQSNTGRACRCSCHPPADAQAALDRDSRREMIRWVTRLIDYGKGSTDPELYGLSIGQVADRLITCATPTTKHGTAETTENGAP